MGGKMDRVCCHLVAKSIWIYLVKALTILFGRWGPLTRWNYARREKKFDISLFFLFFPPTCPKIKGFFFQKLHKFQLNSFIFTVKSHFPTFFIFSSNQSQNVNFYFNFFSSDEAQNTLVGARRRNNIVRAALQLKVEKYFHTGLILSHLD